MKTRPLLMTLSSWAGIIQNEMMLWKTRTNRNSPEAMFHNIERTEQQQHFTLSVSLSCSHRWAWIFNAQQFFSFFLVEGLFEHINWELTSLRLDTPFWYHFKLETRAMKIVRCIILYDYKCAIVYTVRPCDVRFLGKEKMSAAENSCNYWYLIGWREDDQKKTCWSRVESGWSHHPSVWMGAGRVGPWGLQTGAGRVGPQGQNSGQGQVGLIWLD